MPRFCGCGHLPPPACAMGTEARLLFVVSIMSALVSGNTNAAVMAIAEKASDLMCAN